jgi:N12 class adenine-specific DNA methylase
VRNGRLILRTVLLSSRTAVQRLLHDHRGIAKVIRDSEMAIDEFTRSGNTFAKFAFMMSQKRMAKVAHPTDAAGQQK